MRKRRKSIREERDDLLAALIALERLTHDPMRNPKLTEETAAAWAEARRLIGEAKV